MLSYELNLLPKYQNDSIRYHDVALLFFVVCLISIGAINNGIPSSTKFIFIINNTQTNATSLS